MMSLIFAGALVGCAGPSRADPIAAPVEEAARAAALPDRIALFALNVQDWRDPVRSAETIGWVLDQHEAHGVPLDVYLTGPALRGYLARAPALVERLKTSPLVAISHHARPPMPYYPAFDHAALAGMDEAARVEALTRLETHAMDMATGQTLDAPGGFGLEASTFGAPPISVGLADGPGAVSQTLARVFVDLGAKMVATHGHDCALGDRVNGLLCRPDHAQVKIFESTREKMSALFTAALDGAADHEGPFFLWAKIHESDFYSLEAPWRPIYYRGGDRSQPLPPPYDLATPPGAQKTEDQQAATRQRYTSAVRWVASHRDRVAPMNLAQVMATVD